MRTKKDQSRSVTARANGTVPSVPAGISILSGRTKAEIGRIRRDGAGWLAYVREGDGSYRPLGRLDDFAAALAAVPDPQPEAAPPPLPAALPVAKSLPATVPATRFSSRAKRGKPAARTAIAATVGA